jgi:hypothetical protein
MAHSINSERDGFQLTHKMFTPPDNTSLLDPATKRKVTICNLFANHRLSVPDITRILDEPYEKVIAALIEQGLIQERRQSPRPSASRSRVAFIRH